MERARKTLQIIRIAFVIAVALYVHIVRTTAPVATPNPLVFYGIAALAISEIGAILIFKRLMIVPVERTLRAEPDNSKAVNRWRAWYICLYGCSLAVAIYGLILHFLGFSPSQIAPFFIVSVILIVVFAPPHLEPIA